MLYYGRKREGSHLMCYETESQAAQVQAILSVSTPGFLIHGGEPMSKKECFCCKKVKPLGAFYAHPGTADGHLGKCKECVKAYALLRRHTFGREKVLDYDNNRPNKRERGRKQAEKMTYRRRKGLLPEGYDKCHSALAWAVKNGRIKKPSVCSCCGKEGRIEGHHKDYSKPLDVTWLLSVCHRRLHLEIGFKE